MNHEPLTTHQQPPVQVTWTTEMQLPIVSFLTHMTNVVRDGRMSVALLQLSIIVTADQHLPAKVSEAVTRIYSKGLEQPSQADAGLTAVFLGIQQGKLYLKNANKIVLEAQTAGGSNLEDLTKNLEALEAFASKMPSTISKDFAWEQAVSLGILAFKSLVHMISETPRTAPQTTKTSLSDGKRILSEYVATISRAYLVGPFQGWFFEAATGLEISTVPKPLDVQFADWKGIASSRNLTGDACQMTQHAIAASNIITTVFDALTIAVKPTANAHRDLLPLSDSVINFQDKIWTALSEAGLIHKTGSDSFSKVCGFIKQHLQGHIITQTNDAFKSCGCLIAKDWSCGETKYFF